MDQQNTTMTPNENFNINKDHLKGFYKDQLPTLLKTVFLNPIEGVFRLFSIPNSVSYVNTIILMLSVMLLYFIVPYLMVGSELREFIGFSVLLKCALMAGLFMVVVSGLAFGIKSISGKPKFKKELLTGALSGIGLVLLLLVLFITSLTVSRMDLYSFLDPGSLMDQAGAMMVFTIYIFLFFINIMQQSLKASGTSDALSWYVSPLAVILAFYLTYKIAKGFFF